MNLNFKNGFYEYKFGRKPKQWSIEMVHDLWCRTLDRSNKRRKDLILLAIAYANCSFALLNGIFFKVFHFLTALSLLPDFKRQNSFILFDI